LTSMVVDGVRLLDRARAIDERRAVARFRDRFMAIGQERRQTVATDR
jgi:hypothetical protein